ncbi:MAG: ribosome maturation factor RimM, partial [Bacillota bacterium]|nr:ribosome maturation factor RimM [Bacillota bacterium]
MEMMTIGQIVNTHGIKGEIKVFPLTDDSSRFKKLKSVYLEGIETKIESVKIGTKVVILKLSGIDTPEEAEKYKFKYLDIDRRNAVTLAKDSYFVVDIVGCSVFDTNGLRIGEVTKVLNLPSNDVYQVMGDKEILIPALKSVVKEINTVDKKIIIRPVG